MSLSSPKPPPVRLSNELSSLFVTLLSPTSKFSLPVVAGAGTAVDAGAGGAVGAGAGTSSSPYTLSP